MYKNKHTRKQGCTVTEEIIQKKPHKWSAALFTAIINTCKLCCISNTAKSILILTHENSCYAFTSLAVWKLELTTILSIYGKNHPITKLKHAAQNNKLSALSSAEIYRMVQLNQHEWHTNTYRHKMWVGILENKNVGYKSICTSGKVNNGFLNDLFQVYVY